MSTLMLEPEAVELLAAQGVTYPAHALAGSADEAVDQAERLGYPVVLKAVSPQVTHKSDAGAVLVGLADAVAVRQGYRTILANVAAHDPQACLKGMLVCALAPTGVEVIVGGLQDPVFGPTVMCGLGGIFTEIMGDVAFRVAPLQPGQARGMVRELKGFPLLNGARGQAPCDLASLAGVIRAVATIMERHPHITELDLNPVRVFPRGAMALDARIMIKDIGE